MKNKLEGAFTLWMSFKALSALLQIIFFAHWITQTAEIAVYGNRAQQKTAEVGEEGL